MKIRVNFRMKTTLTISCYTIYSIEIAIESDWVNQTIKGKIVNSKTVKDQSSVEVKPPSIFVLTCVLVILSIVMAYGAVMCATVAFFPDVKQKQSEVRWVANFVSGSIGYYESHYGVLKFAPDGQLKTASGKDFTLESLVDNGVLEKLPNLKTMQNAYLLENADDFMPGGDVTKGRILASETGHQELVNQLICSFFMKMSDDPTRSGCGFDQKKGHYAYWQRL